MTLATQPRSKSKVTSGIAFYLTIDEEAKGSLDLVKALRAEPKVISLERTGNGFYFIVGTESAITKICDQHPGCLMKMETVL